MKYFATLILGEQYLISGQTFIRGEEQSVTKEFAEKLEGKVQTILVAEGNGHVVKDLPRFTIRTEKLTVEEKVTEEIKDAPDTLKLNKPGRKPAA